ncbi:PAAR domain-containing protein [Bosea sp. TWI1241]|uniref:PAAR domain-containing protein n=1 Tax=Bosea sp. TWI1241 TaxID=3148904 RepID=UPI003208E7CA
MPGITVKGADSAGGTQLAGGQDFVTVDGNLVVVKGDPVEAHGPPPHSPEPTMVEGCAWFTINGTPVCREGHEASCGHATTGQGWVQVVG